MDTLLIQVFRDSFSPMLKVLNEHDAKYMMREQRSGAVMAVSGILEVVLHAPVNAD